MNPIFPLVVIIFSAIIHEYMHGWMAERLGDNTAKDAGRLTLNPLVHIDLWGSIIMPALIWFGTSGSMFFGYAKPVPFNPNNLRDQRYGSAKVAVAGPAANLITAVFFGLVLRFYPITSQNLADLLSSIVLINIMLMVFNLVPIPPLDGSKVVMPFLPYNWQVRFAELERYGFLLVLMFIMFGFSFILPIIYSIFKLIVG